MHRRNINYPGLDHVFSAYLHQDWNYKFNSIVKVVGDVLEEIQLSGVTKEQLEMFSWVTLPQLHTEIYDIVKRKTVDEQFDIFDKFEVSGPNIPYKHNVECFFITVLYLTETEMRKRGLEIPENPPLHTATA